MLNLVFFGPPGAGKGTQAKLTAKAFELIHLSTGDMLRSEMARETALGKQAKEKVENGELVPDETVIAMIAQRIDKLTDGKGFIFDGFPRTAAQAQALDEMLASRDTQIRTLIELQVPKNELVSRLQARAEKENRSDDKDIRTIENRIKVYHENTLPVKDHYQGQNKYTPIEGTGAIEVINQRINEAVENL